MKNLILLVTLFLSLVGQGQVLQDYLGHRFTIKLTPVFGENIPGYHSGAIAVWGGKWLYIGGRTNGLHGLNVNDGFPTEFANNVVTVIDTATWTAQYASLNQLPATVADPLRSTNMQFYQKDSLLFMVGGYGWDSTLFDFNTFPTLSIINIPQMISAVEAGDSIHPYITQLVDTNFAVGGGELAMQNDTFLLVMGHKFIGRYDPNPNSTLFTQRYTDAIRAFLLNTDTAGNFIPTILPEWRDTVNFHRRDFSMAPFFRCITSSLFCDTVKQDGFQVLGGVFKRDKDLPYTNSVRFNYSTQQKFISVENTLYSNSYTAPVISIFSTWSNTNLHIRFGGMGDVRSIDVPSFSDLELDTLVPFTKRCTGFGGGGGQIYFRTNTTITDPKLPDYLGTNASFISNTGNNVFCAGFGPVNFTYNNEEQPALGDVINGTGYLFGGIRGTQPNNGPSSANDTIYRVSFIYGHPQISNVNETPVNLNLNVYPNPTKNQLAVSLQQPGKNNVTLNLYTLQGQLLNTQTLTFVGQAQATVPTTNLAAGMYLLKAQTPNGIVTQRVVVE